ncbi:hypothetical protein ACH4VT_01145 [Streptomyces lydicus]
MSSNTAIVRDATERYRTARREVGESRGAFETEIDGGDLGRSRGVRG